MSLTVDRIRAQFPALRRMHNGHAVAYFDGPGGTQVPQSVADAITDYLFHHNANTHWEYPTSAETDAMLADARQTMATFVNGTPEEIAFGANMTTLTFHLARSLGRAWGPGDEIVVTELDHHANVAPWQAIADERGVTIRSVRMDTVTGRLDMEDLTRAITPRCRLLAIGAASNALGTVTDVRAATDIAHAAGARVFVDAVHYAPHNLVDVSSLDCDFLGCSPYKFYGPHLGMIWVRSSIVNNLDVPKLMPAPDHGGERLETGTQNHEGIMGAAAAVRFIAGIGADATADRAAAAAAAGAAAADADGVLRDNLKSAYDVMHARAARQVARLWDGLKEHPRCTLYGPDPDTARTSTVAFTIDGIASSEVARALARRGVFVSHGDFYAATVIERLGVGPEGLVRVGCSCYNTDDEIERLLGAVAELITGT
jgi:cysteine desulfurase family protein (TIGR01976 family)